MNRALEQPCLNYIARRESSLARQRSRFLKDLTETRRSHPVLDPEPEFLPDVVEPGSIVETGNTEPGTIVETGTTEQGNTEPQPQPSLLILPPFTAQKTDSKERTPATLKPRLISPPERTLAS